MQGRFKVITLCGSTRFRDEYMEAQKRLTLEGHIVISVGLFGHSGDSEVWNEGVKETLDEMHLSKIDMADEIYVVNPGGYVGKSTSREIAYALSQGKNVSSLCPLDLGRYDGVPVRCVFSRDFGGRLAKALSDTKGCKAENNRQFVKRELERNRTFFDTVLKYPLDAQQREAVVSLEDNVLVISSAGSGKTMTTVGKVRYLVDRQGVDPSRILLITFTRKAAESLSERLGEKSLRCVTFHKLALDIIAEATGRRPTIADTAMPALVYHDLMDNDAAFRSAVTDYILGSRYRMPDQFEYGSREEYIEARRKYGVNAYYKDMDGRPVFCKSDEESRICDFLGRNGIRFRYEERYEKDTVDTDHRQYCPDFSIYSTGGDGKLRRVYLEHFAVNAAGRCPGWFSAEDERKYIEGIEWKRRLHSENGTVLLETRSADFHSGEVFRRLAGELRAAGIEPTKDGEDSGLSRELARQEQSILDMLTAFHFLLRSRGETTERLLSRVKRKDLDTINGIIVPYMSRYDAMCREKGVIDFTGAIVRATELCLEGHRHDYDYILVDEFQDISAAKLLNDFEPNY
jgi:DNA helicase IV